jgi:hypothetical protein
VGFDKGIGAEHTINISLRQSRVGQRAFGCLGMNRHAAAILELTDLSAVYSADDRLNHHGFPLPLIYYFQN